METNSLEQQYVDSSTRHGLVVDLENYKITDRTARALVTALVEKYRDNKDASPYLVLKLNNGLYYFVKVVQPAVYVNVVTRGELASLGYEIQED